MMVAPKVSGVVLRSIDAGKRVRVSSPSFCDSPQLFTSECRTDPRDAREFRATNNSNGMT